MVYPLRLIGTLRAKGDRQEVFSTSENPQGSVAPGAASWTVCRCPDRPLFAVWAGHGPATQGDGGADRLTTWLSSHRNRRGRSRRGRPVGRAVSGPSCGAVCSLAVQVISASGRV